VGRRRPSMCRVIIGRISWAFGEDRRWAGLLNLMFKRWRSQSPGAVSFLVTIQVKGWMLEKQA
jgi:hypothetical protein